MSETTESEAPTKDYPQVPEFVRENWLAKAAEIAEREDINASQALDNLVQQWAQSPGNEALIEWANDHINDSDVPVAKPKPRKTVAKAAE